MMRIFLLVLFSFSATSSADASSAVDTPRPLDVYGRLSCVEEKARLDNVARALIEHPRLTGVVVIYGGRNDTKRGEALARLFGIRDYLVMSRVDAHRIVLLNGGYRESLEVQLWGIEYREHAPLLVNPTVDPKEVRLRKGRVRRWSYNCAGLARWGDPPRLTTAYTRPRVSVNVIVSSDGLGFACAAA